MRAPIRFALLLAAVLLGGCRVSPPSKFETHVVVFTKHHITVRNKSQRNPMAMNAQNLAAGKEAFGHYCTACHGLDGQNTGVPFAETLSPPLPSLASADVQRYTDGQLKWILDNGISPSGMPASKTILSDDERWSIVLYLRHLPPAGSLGEPAIYSH